ncbi:MAG: hypothetical protein ACOC6F_02370 [bacterium]
MNRNSDVWIGVCLALLMGVSLYFGLSQHPSSFDDAYITYRYARNVAQGRGLVYNSGEPVLGTTTPLYTLLLAGLALIWQDIPALSHAVGVMAWALCVPVVYGIGRTADKEICGLAAASLAATNALFLNVLGMETTTYILLTLLTFYFYLSKRATWAALCAGLAFLTRWDGILVVAVLMFAQTLRDRREVPKMLIICASLILPWLVYSQLRFGSIFPNTFFAKAGQGWKKGLGGIEIGPFPRGLVSIARSAWRENRLFLIPVGLSVVGAFSAFRNRVKWWPVVLWTAAYFGGYAVLGVLRFPWYYPPLVPAVLLLIGEGIKELTECLQGRSRQLKLGLTVLLIPLCLVPNVDWLMANRRSEMNKHLATYVQVGEWLRDHTPLDSSVATIEIGVIGFYSDRTIVDTMGLVSPEMVGHLDTWLQTLQFALNYYWPDYAVVLEGTAWGGVIREPWFREAYVLETKVENLGDPDAPLRIYRRRTGFPPSEFDLVSTREVRFDQRLALHRFEVSEDQVRPGERLYARLTWEALANLERDYLLQFDLVNATDGRRRTLARGVRPMHGGNPTTLWDRGDRIVDAHTLEIPCDVEAGPHLLQLMVSGPSAQASMTSRVGTPVTYVSVGPMQIGDVSAESIPGAYRVDAAFADSIHLVGYDLERIDRGELEVVLYWKATGDVSRDYTVFVHLLSLEGDLVAQHDSPPRLPTKLWAPGTPVVDAHLLSLPPNSSRVNYEVRVGMYHWPDLERLPVITSNDLDAENDALFLRNISVEQSQAPCGLMLN